MSLLDELSTGAWIKWDDLGQGTIVTGSVISTKTRQANEFQSTEPAFWKDGSPKMEYVITLATELRDPEDPQDDGTRSLSINLWSGQKSALIAALKAAGARDIKTGDEFAAVWTAGVGKTGSPRVFAYKLTPGGGKLSTVLATAPAQADPWAAHQAPAAHPAPAPAPVPTVTPAAQPAGASPVDGARQLLAAGLGIADVAAATGLSAQIVAALAGTVQSAGPAPF